MRLSRATLALLMLLVLAGVRPAAAQAPTSVPYPAGWNLIAAPTGTTIPTDVALYAQPPGQATEMLLPPDAPLSDGAGYWAYFSQPQALLLAPGSTAVELQFASGETALAGNPSGDHDAAVFGAASVTVYDPVAGFQDHATLAPGQGAIVTSADAGSVEIFALARPDEANPDSYSTSIELSLAGISDVSTQIGAALSDSSPAPEQLAAVQAQLQRLRDETGRLRAFLPPPCLAEAHGRFLRAAGLLDRWSAASAAALDANDPAALQSALDFARQAAEQLRLGRAALAMALCP